MSLLETIFPQLVNSGYAITSTQNDDYNCISWAVGEMDRWWWPDVLKTSYWPDGVPREETLPAFVAAFATLRYAITTCDDYEPNVEKLAINCRSGVPAHAARQLPNGRWTSKLGLAEDIEHSLSDLVGTLYGDVAVVLARPTA